MRETTIEVGGAKVRALEAGAGPTVLFLHGLDGPRADPLVLELARTNRVVVPEFPGFGRTPLPGWLMGIDDAALFGLDLVAALGVERPHLAGHSIGGWIAVEMAVRHPTPFASLSLVAPMGVQSDGPLDFDVFIPPPDEVVRAQFHDQTLAQKEIDARANEDIDIVLQNRTGLARLGWSPRYANVRLPHWLHRVRAPTLLLWGDDDRIVPVDRHAVFKREIPRIDVVRYTACGHALPFERGADAARRIAAFVAGAR
jgi:pimeloyl-ACP methyl ester carboxylesterase